jgi:RHS repeat-associated protein
MPSSGEIAALTVTDARGHVVTYGHDERGNRNRQVDANMRETRFEYDKRGRQTKRILPDGKFETKTYDAQGRLTTRTDFMSRTTTFQYDQADRVTLKTYPDSSTVAFSHTPTGERATATDSRGTTTYGRDNRDRVTSLTYPDGRVLSFGFDADGNRTSLTATVGPAVLSTSYTYDLAGRMGTVTAPGARVFTLEYNGVGYVSKLLRPNGTETRYTYDNLNRLTDVRTVNTMTAATLSSYSYTLGPTGLRTRMDEGDGTAHVYEYDELFRLTKETVTGPGPNYVKTFGYDSVSNRLSQVTTGTGAASVSYTYDSRDRLLTENSVGYTHDDNGNQLSRSGGEVYTWDFDNRLTKVTKPDGTIIEHAYDFDGNRVQTKVTPPVGPASVTNLLVDTTERLSQVVAESDGGGAPQAYYVRTGTQVLAIVRGGDVRYLVSDGLGSVRELRDDSGVATDTYGYTPYGELATRTGADPQPYGFAGEAVDARSGLSYHRARWMDSRTGRFVSADPLGETSMASEGSRPLHLFAYADATPVNKVDPAGLFGEGIAVFAPSVRFIERARTTQQNPNGWGGLLQVWCRYADAQFALNNAPIFGRIWHGSSRHCGVRIRFNAADGDCPPDAPYQFGDTLVQLSGFENQPGFDLWPVGPAKGKISFDDWTGPQSNSISSANVWTEEPGVRLRPGFGLGERQVSVRLTALALKRDLPVYRLWDGPNSNTFVRMITKRVADVSPPDAPGWFAEWPISAAVKETLP